MGDAIEKDGNEPFERVLVHRVDVGEIGDAEEQDLSVDSHWNILTSGDVDISLGLLRDHHFRLSNKQQFQSSHVQHLLYAFTQR